MSRVLSHRALGEGEQQPVQVVGQRKAVQVGHQLQLAVHQQWRVACSGGVQPRQGAHEAAAGVGRPARQNLSLFSPVATLLFEKFHVLHGPPAAAPRLRQQRSATQPRQKAAALHGIKVCVSWTRLSIKRRNCSLRFASSGASPAAAAGSHASVVRKLPLASAALKGNDLRVICIRLPSKQFDFSTCGPRAAERRRAATRGCSRNRRWRRPPYRGIAWRYWRFGSVLAIRLFKLMFTWHIMPLQQSCDTEPCIGSRSPRGTHLRSANTDHRLRQLRI